MFTRISNFTTYIGFKIVLVHLITNSTLLTSYAQNLQKFVTFKELYEKPAVLKTAAEAFKTLFKRFHAVFKGFEVSEADFLIKLFPVNKRGVYPNSSSSFYF